MATRADSALLDQYGCGAVRFAGTNDALYERHLLLDNAIDLGAATPRDRFEAFARSVRDVLSQRWVLTEKTYERHNPKRLYYLSLEFLIGRSLANNVTNLLLNPYVEEAIQQKNLNWIELLEQEPDAGLGNGGLGRLAACFMESAATMQLPAMGYGLRYEYGIFKQRIGNGWQEERPDNWLRRQDPWEVQRPEEKVEIGLNCGFEVRGGSLRAVAGRPSSLFGIPFDRPVVGYGGRTINTQVKNFLTLTMLSLGVPMIVMGDEVRRTQRGNNNAHCQDNEISWFDWTLLSKHGDLHRFVRMLIARRLLRDVEPERRRVSLNQWLLGAKKAWHGVKLDQPDWSYCSHSLAFGAELPEQALRLHLILNAYWEPLDFELPLLNGGKDAWRLWIDTALEPPNEIVDWQAASSAPGRTYRAGARSVVVLIADMGLHSTEER